MPTFRATDPDGVVTEYDAATPIPAHFAPGWRIEELITIIPSPDDAPPADTRKYQGRRLLTKLEFIDLFTDAEYAALIAAAKSSIALEAWIKKLDYAQPDADGYAVHLDNSATQMGVQALEMMGLLAAGRSAEILNG